MTVTGVRFLVAALLLALLCAPAAAAGTAPKAPSFRAIDSGRDIREGPGGDRWALHAVDPRSLRTLRVLAGLSETQVWIKLNDKRQGGWELSAWPGYGFGHRPLKAPGFRRVSEDPDGGPPNVLELRRVRGGWTLRSHGPGLIVDLRIRSRGAGPTLVSRHPEASGLLRRAMPVMDGVASGRLFREGIDERPVAIRGWRVSFTHDWYADDGLPPCCDPSVPIAYPRCCQDTDVAVVHERGGATAVIGGRTVAGDGDRGRWSGIVARRRGGRLTWCRATLREQTVSARGPERLDAGCRGGPRVRLRMIDGGLFFRHDAWVDGRRTRTASWHYRSDGTVQAGE